MSKKQIMPQSKDITRDDKEYQTLLVELTSILSKGQSKAYKAVDNIKV